MKMSNKTFDTLKWVAQYLLPAAGVLFGVLATTWNLPYGTQITATIAAADTFLGACLGISTHNYNKNIEDITDAE